MRSFFLLTFSFCLLISSVSYANDWVSTDYLQARLIGGVSEKSVESSSFQAGFEVRLAQGWHTYWRMPGDSGLPPRFDWTGSKNVKAVEVDWPTPVRITDMDIQSFGYKNTFLMPLTVHVVEPAHPVDLQLSASLMVCRDICIPQDLTLSLHVPAGEKADSSFKAHLEAAKAKLPAEENRPDIKIENLVIGPDALVLTVFSQRGYDQADVFIDAADAVYLTSVPEFILDEKDPRKAMARVAASEGVENLVQALENATVNVVFSVGRQAVAHTYIFSLK